MNFLTQKMSHLDPYHTLNRETRKTCKIMQLNNLN